MQWLIGKPHFVQLLGRGLWPQQPAAAPADAGPAPGIVGNGDELPCIIMELCGASLEGPKVHTEAEARVYVQQVLQAAAELHQGVKHKSGRVAIMRHRWVAG
jgi:hypothetical protein